MRQMIALVGVLALVGCGGDSPVSPSLYVDAGVNEKTEVTEAAAPEPESSPEPTCEWVAMPSTPVWETAWTLCAAEHTGRKPPASKPACWKWREGWKPLVEQNSCSAEVRTNILDVYQAQACSPPCRRTVPAPR